MVFCAAGEWFAARRGERLPRSEPLEEVRRDPGDRINRARQYGALGILENFLPFRVSTDPERRSDVRRAAEFLAQRFRDAGLPHVEIVPTKGHPIVLAEWKGAPGAPTILIYGHYVSAPRRSVEVDDPRVRAAHRRRKDLRARFHRRQRAAATHLFAAEAHLRETGKLPLNVKFLIEGEEEIGSEHLGEFLIEHRARLACDAVVISDTAMYAPGVPSICTGLRGIAYTEFTIRGAVADLHSGGFGGAVDNPAFALARLLVTMKDPKTGRILVDGFYDGVVEPSAEEKAGWAKLTGVDARFQEMTGVPRLFGEEGRCWNVSGRGRRWKSMESGEVSSAKEA